MIYVKGLTSLFQEFKKKQNQNETKPETIFRSKNINKHKTYYKHKKFAIKNKSKRNAI